MIMDEFFEEFRLNNAVRYLEFNSFIFYDGVRFVIRFSRRVMFISGKNWVSLSTVRFDVSKVLGEVIFFRGTIVF